MQPALYPARELVCPYGERWEVEITIDEIGTQQRLVNRPLRSLPWGAAGLVIPAHTRTPGSYRSSSNSSIG